MKCRLCNRSVVDSFRARWNHLVKLHPDQALNALRPLADSDAARELGKSVALRIKRRLEGRR